MLEKYLFHYIIHFNFIAFRILLSNASHPPTTVPFLRTPDAFNATIQSNRKISLGVCTLTVFPHITKISVILGLVIFPAASNILLFYSIASSSYEVAFPKVVCLAIYDAFITALAAQFFSLLSAFLSFKSLIPHITFSAVSPVTPHGIRQISLYCIPFCLFFWQNLILKRRSPGVIVVFLPISVSESNIGNLSDFSS